MASQALIELVPFVDPSKLESAVSQLENSGGVTENDAAAYKAANAELQKRNTLQQTSQQVEKQQLATISQVQKGVSGMATALVQEAAAQQKADQAAQKFTVTARQQGTAVSGVLKSAGQYTAVLVAAVKPTDDLKKKTESLRTEKKRLQQQIAQLLVDGKKESAMYAELVERAGEIDDAIADANASIKRAGSDTRGLDNVLQLAGGLTAAFSVAQGAAALFGEENEAVQETLLKVNAAMAILNGLQQIQAIVRDESIRSLVLENRTRIINNANIAIENGLNSSSVVVRAAATVAQRALNAAMAANPISLIVVALATLIGLFAVYKITLGNVSAAEKERNATEAARLEVQKDSAKQMAEELTNLDSYLRIAKSETATREQKREAIDKIRASYPEYLGFITQEKVGTQETARAIERQIALIKERAMVNAAQSAYQGKLEAQIAAQVKLNNSVAILTKSFQYMSRTQEELDANITRSTQREQAALENATAEANGYFTVLKDAQESLNAVSHRTTLELQAQIDLYTKTMTYLPQVAGTLKGLITDLKSQQNANAGPDYVKQLEEQVEHEKNLLRVTQEGSTARIAASKRVASAESALAKERVKQSTDDERTKNIQLEAIDAEYTESVNSSNIQLSDMQRAALQRRLAAEKGAVENLLAIAREGSTAQLQEQEALIRKQAELDLAGIQTRNASAAVVAQERKNIEDRVNAELARVRLANSLQQQKDTRTIELINAEVRVAAYRDGTYEYYEAQRAFRTKQAENAALEVRNSLQTEDQKSAAIRLIYGNLTKDLDELARQRQERIITQQRAAIDALDDLATSRLQRDAADPRKSEAERFRAEQSARTEVLRKVAVDQERIDEDYKAGRIKSKADYERQLTENTKAGEEARFAIIVANVEREKAIRQALQSEISKLANDFIQSEYNTGKASRDAALQEELQRLSDERDAAVNAKNTTEEQKANIDKRYKAEESRIRKEAAIKEREAQRRMIIANGIVAAINALATVQPFYAAIIAAAGVAITTGLQLAALDRTPLPAYAKGTKSARRGLALVGEEGPELVRFSGGEQVYTARESDSMMRSWNAADHASQIAEYNSVFSNTNTFEIDYDLLAKRLAEHIPEPNVIQNNLDQEGYTTFIIKRGSRRRVLNKRFQKP